MRMAFLRVGRPVSGTAWQVAQQQRFKARVLPDDGNTVFLSEIARAVRALRLAHSLIFIKESKTRHGRCSCAAQFFYTLNRQHDARQGISGAGRQFVDDDMQGQSPFSGQVPQYRRVMNFRCALAPNINRRPERDMSPSSRHPSIGTPP